MYLDITALYTDIIKDMADKGMAAFIDWLAKNNEEESKCKLESFSKDSSLHLDSSAFIDWLAKNNEEESKCKLESLLKDRNYMNVVKDKFEEGKEEEMRTIMHNDARSNNIMFKYGSDNVTPVGMTLL